MDGLAGVNGSFHVLDQDRVLEHLAIPDGFGDEGELLVHDAACTHVGVEMCIRDSLKPIALVMM